MVIHLDEHTARQLLEAASSQGMTVAEFVRVHLLSTNTGPEQYRSIVGAMSHEVELLDEAVEDAFAARERDPLSSNKDA